MSRKVDIKLLKVIDAGHFKASPIATPGSDLENFMGQLNDYFIHERDPYASAVSPLKGKLYVIQRTMDQCWYRARILNIMQTTAGPQASVLLVDVGEQTLIPCSRVREIPKQFENIPYQVMDCHLIAVKPLRLVTSYFDLSTTKQVSDSWTEAATKFFHKVISGCKLEVTIQREDGEGHYHVLLHGTSPQKQVCVNDELVQQGFAEFSDIDDESPRKAERRRLQQEKFKKQQQQVMDAFTNNVTSSRQDESTSTDEEGSSTIRPHRIPSDTRAISPLNFLRQQVVEMRQSSQSNESTVSFIPAGSEITALSSRSNKSPKTLSSPNDDNSGRVRFVSARIPKTGSGIPSLSREDDSSRLKSILKTGKISSSSSGGGEEPVPIRSPWYPEQSANMSQQCTGQNINAPRQYPGCNESQSTQYPGKIQEYPGQNTNVSTQYHGQNAKVIQQYSGQNTNAASQYPGQNASVTQQQTGQNTNVSSQHPRQHQSLPSQYDRQGTTSSSLYPWEGQELSLPNQSRNTFEQFPEMDKDTPQQYPTKEAYPHFPGKETNVPQQFPRQDQTTSSNYPGQNEQVSPQHPGLDRAASHQYPGQIQTASLHWYHGQDEELNPQFTRNDHTQFSQYPGQEKIAPPQNSGQNKSTSSQYLVQERSVPPQYPGQLQAAPSRDTSIPKQYVAREDMSSFSPGEEQEISLRHSSREHGPHQQNTQTDRNTEWDPTQSTSYDNRIQNQQLIRDRDQPQNDQSNGGNQWAHLQSLSHDERMLRKSHQDSQDNERIQSYPSHYPETMSSSLNSATQQYDNQSLAERESDSLHSGQAALSSMLGLVQNTCSSSISQDLTKPMQRLPSHALSQMRADPTPNPSQGNTASARLPSVAITNSQSQRLPSDIMNQKPLVTQHSSESEISIQDGVLVHGEGAPKPFLSMDNCPLHEKGTRLNITVPTPLQRHMWPALLRGRDVAAVAKRNTGKKLSYLLPIMDQVMESSAYSELPLTNGPLALILCSSWGSAIEIYQECNKILGNRRTARVHVIFGGGAEDEQIIPVLNGCEVLVATVPCFLRMLKRGYTPMDRVCHIVFDNANVLVEDFTSELKDIMRVYGHHLKSQPGRIAPRQTVVMATSWTVGVASLTRAYLGNPLIIIHDQVEAAVYCGLKQTVELCSSSQRLSRLLGFLDNADKTHEIVIFTNTAQEAESLAEILGTSNYFVLVAHEFMTPPQLADVRRQWYSPHNSDLMPILVLTDGVLMGRLLAIHNASMVIHYDFPVSRNKEKLGWRFFCMANTFTATKAHGCLSVIFITETCMRQATVAHELVRRTQQLSPSEDVSVDTNNTQALNSTLLEQMADTALMAKERDKVNSDLCDFMMAYGTCRTFADKKRCTMRHVVISEQDYPYDLPTMGMVKVLVLYAMNAGCLWVRILEHRNPKGEVVSTSNSSKFVQMTIDMGVWYGNPDNRKKISMPKESDLCGLEDGGSYHRVKVCGVVNRNSNSGMPLDVQVLFVDKGTDNIVQVSSLLQLPQQFQTLPFQAVQVFICRIKPQDKNQQWTPKANNFVKNLVEGKELEGKVVLSLGNMLWLDPLWEKKYLKSINVTTNINNIRIELLKNGLAVENKLHIKQLRKLCDDVIDLSIFDGIAGEGGLGADSSTTLETVTLPEEDYQDVYVSAVDTPGLFFVQLASYKEQIEELQNKIDVGVSVVQFEQDEEIPIGSLCLACFTNNDEWYRAQVLGIRPENEYDVFYVDYGDREWIQHDRLRPAWPDIITLPLQAIECSLVNIVPTENDWTPEDSQALWDRCEERLLFAKVKSKVASLMSGCHRFVVELVDTSSSIDVNFSEELVTAGHAQTSTEGIQTLFPEADVLLTGENYQHEYEKIPDMCKSILQARDPSQRVSIAKSLQTIVLNSLNSKDAVRERGGVRSICRLLALTRSPAVQEHLLVSLECLTFQNDSNCEEVRREGGLKSLCHLIERTSNLTIKEHVAWTLKNLAATDKNKYAIREMGGLGILCNELDHAMDEKVQQQIIWALEILATDNTKNCQIIQDNGGIRMLSELVLHGSQEFVLERATRALSALAVEPSNRNVIRQEGGLLAICRRIQDNPSEDFLRVASSTLKTVASNNQHNREVMKEIGMVHTLQKITSSSTHSAITRRLCCDLLERLIGWAAAEISGSPTKPSAPTTPTTSTTTPVAPPMVNGTSKHNGVSSIDDLPSLEGSGDESGEEQQAAKKTFKIKQPIVRPVPKRQQESSDDTDEQDQTIKSYHPTTMWSQTKDTIRVAVRLRGVKKQLTDLHGNTLAFSTKLRGKKYHLELELYDSVIMEEKYVDVKGDEIMIILKKKNKVAWPRLLHSKDKPAYLSIDFDRWEIWSSSEEDGKEEDENKKKPFVYLPPKPLNTNNNNKKKKKCIVPEMDSSSKSESSDSEGDFGYQEMIDFA